MHVAPVINGLRAALASHLTVASGDPSVEAAGEHLAAALEPAIRQAAIDLAQQAAAEIAAQLPDRTVDVLLVDGEPSLRVSDAPRSAADSPIGEEFDARITLRLPPSLKRVIEDAATIDGDSVNAWVVDALSRRAKRNEGRNNRVTEGFDL